jgi:hypothetical protein
LRLIVALTNMNACQDEEKNIWKNLHEMLLRLGSDGMSSDESDVDEHGRSVYYVRTCPYRSSRLQARLDILDREANHTSGYGTRPAGNPHRIRIRPAEPEESMRRPPVGLPHNFYDHRWLSALTPVLLGYLEAAGDFNLISFDMGSRFAAGLGRSAHAGGSSSGRAGVSGRSY